MFCGENFWLPETVLPLPSLRLPMGEKVAEMAKTCFDIYTFDEERNCGMIYSNVYVQQRSTLVKMAVGSTLQPASACMRTI